MNERIDELMIQAGARFEFLHGVHYDDFQYRKFAELLIIECADVCDSVTTYHDDNNEIKAGVGAWDCRRSIKQHFGVKE